jgi:hypothetical protein
LAVAQPNKKPLGDDLRTRLCELVSVGQRRTPRSITRVRDFRIGRSGLARTFAGCE